MSGVLLILKEHQWARMKVHVPGTSSDPGWTGADNRPFMEAVVRALRIPPAAATFSDLKMWVRILAS